MDKGRKIFEVPVDNQEEVVDADHDIEPNRSVITSTGGARIRMYRTLSQIQDQPWGVGDEENQY